MDFFQNGLNGLLSFSDMNRKHHVRRRQMRCDISLATRQTGITQFGLVLGAKRLELLRELVPKGVYIGVLVNPTNQDAETELKDLQEAAHLLGLKLDIMTASSENDFEAMFAASSQRRADALFVQNDPVFDSRSSTWMQASRCALPWPAPSPSCDWRALHDRLLAVMRTARIIT